MAETRVVHEFREHGPISARILWVDTTDPRHHRTRPYQLARGGYFHDQVVIVELRREDLERLRDDLNHELGR